MTKNSLPGKIVLAAALAAATAGCNMFSGESPAPLQSAQHPAAPAMSDNLPASERLKVRPISSDELDCPSVGIAEGGSMVRVGGPDNASVRYQFTISDQARECVPQGDNFDLKVGISGLLLMGPAGKPGPYSTDLAIVVADSKDKKPLYRKSYKITVDTKGEAQAPFQLVADPIPLPMTRTDLDNLYDVTIGFGKTADTPAEKKTVVKKPTGKKKPKTDQG